MAAGYTDETGDTDGRLDASDTVYFAVVRARIPFERLADDQRLCALAAEDAVWAIWLSDWQHRRPRWFLPSAQRRWIGEGEELYRSRQLLAAECVALGVGRSTGT